MIAIDAVRENVRALSPGADYHAKFNADERHKALREQACTCRPMYGSHDESCALRDLCKQCCGGGYVYIPDANTSIECACEFGGFPWRRP